MTTTTNFRVRTQAAAFVDGYQSGMEDLARAYVELGEAGVVEWLRNNVTRDRDLVAQVAAAADVSSAR